MAEAMIVGALVSAGVDLLINKLASPEFIGFFKRQKLDDGMRENLKETMTSVNKLLNDAEEKQIEQKEVKAWLDKLKHAVYEADDFLDEIAYNAMELELEDGPHTPRTCSDQMRTFVSSLIPCKKGMGEKQPELKGILQNLEGLVQQKDGLGLKELIIGGTSVSQEDPETSLVDASGICGRDTDKKAIMELLQSDGAKDRRYDVIPIVGMPGVGKTTLAKLVYNEIQDKGLFDLKAWVYVSAKLDVLKVTKDILKELTSQTGENMTENQLHTKLQEQLKDKKVFLVLDDVWSEKQRQWQFLLEPFNVVAHGSKIVVTTRHESVASVRSTVPSHHLRELTEEDCWLVFRKHAFSDGNSNEHPELEQFGREIVKRCDGLPLAAEAIGSLLRLKRDVEDWKKILKSDIWESSNDNILPFLKLSYHHLPSHLKQCFAYCGMFPKGTRFSKELLVPFWMAEGFLGDMKMEELGDKYFEALVSRSFLQKSNSAKNSLFVMHDLFNDFAKLVSGEFCFSMEDENSGQPTERTRYLSASVINSNAFESIYELAPFLRTLDLVARNLEERCINTVLPRFKRLRVLSLWGREATLPGSIGNLKHLRLLILTHATIKNLPETVCTLLNLQTLKLDHCILHKLPDSIGNLKRLRFLSLQGTGIDRLPQSASGLCDLQTLNLYGCVFLVELPDNMMELTNLCYLDIRMTRLKSMPSEMGKLTKLKQLTDFFVGKQKGSSIKELGKLQHLKGKLCIRNLQNIENVGDSLAAKLGEKNGLEELELRWDGRTDGSAHHRILEQLRPHTNVKSLDVFNYGGSTFPDWIGDSSFSKIATLHLTGCKYVSFLPPVGNLWSLKDLSIEEFDGVEAIGPEFYGSRKAGSAPFASLEILRFQRMPQLKQWQDECGAFSVLRELYIINCPNLTTKPSYRPTLTTLEIGGGGPFPTSLPKLPVIERMKIRHESLSVDLAKGPCSLYSLKIEGFESLDDPLNLVEQLGFSPTAFERLEITLIHSLQYFPVNLVPVLKDLKFSKCPQLKTFSLERHLEDGFTSLKSLSIYDCPNFHFSTGGFTAPNLVDLWINSCSGLQSLPERMYSLLPSLERLSLDKCPELESFPEGGLPAKLHTLRIQCCLKLFSNRMQWGLHTHPSLSRFYFFGIDNVESFPEEMLLPSTVTYLEIFKFENLKSLNYKGIQHLTSLQKLYIFSCPKLECLPEEGLPSSLCSLSIAKCPLLEQSCEKEKGKDWHKISNIPKVTISN